MAKFKENGKLKLLIIVGTRPEIIRLAAVINKCRQYFDCLLAHTGQNYDYNLNGVFFKDLKLADPDIYMEAVGDDLKFGGSVGSPDPLSDEYIPLVMKLNRMGTVHVSRDTELDGAVPSSPNSAGEMADDDGV